MTDQAKQSKTFPRLQNVGLDGLLITFAERLSDGANRAALAFRGRVEAADIEGITETTTSLASTFVLFDPLKSDLDHIRAQLLALLDGTDWADVPLPQGRRLWRVPAAFGGTRGPQLDEAAKLAGIDRDRAIEEMTSTRVRVLTIGFAPGQPYLGTLPPHWNIPRQSGLTKQVPTGAIAVAIRQLVLFTASTPTGWRMIGQTAFRGFRPDQDAPFTLGVGDEILFAPISEQELTEIENTDQTGLGGATSEVIT
ncbi:sensor histidine kinase inhibitor, KipI family [Roseovarius lutimaris]|uniref:Sensor histidine kinase inhibitor, KipI family n=1 Tax=Roseovarius lutimaris TaxID=1005928 RepID=A0A1I4YWH0_9RHOB|nr:allophanate hydrolase subunit 1 [Roseovarius lutimaris]SFN42406.1 sensor histidine kinase inhibitor, KipI family [Roseovarius lutimaris]